MWSKSARCHERPVVQELSHKTGHVAPVRLVPRGLSTLPYLSAWIVGMAGAQWVQYVWPQAVLFKGQPPSILFMLTAWVVSVPLWLMTVRPQRRKRAFLVFLGTLAVAWLMHLAFAVINGDNFNHVVWIYPLMIVMLAWKPPTGDEAWRALVVVAWAITAMLVVTRGLEMAGLLDRYFVIPEVVQFDLQNYWLPFSGSFELLGKWTGPFGASAHSAMAAGFVFVIGVVRWRWSSWVFVTVGVVVYLLSASRTMLLACLAAVFIMVLFSKWGALSRVPQWIRWLALSLAAILGAVVLFNTGPGLTGRQSIWPAFLDVWRTSPWIGAGATGIEEAGGLAAQSDVAHNLFVDLLARQGVLGLAIAVIALGIATWLGLRSASRGEAGPVAILVAYFIFSMTDVRNEWISMNLPLAIVILATAWATGDGEMRPERETRLAVGNVGVERP